MLFPEVTFFLLGIFSGIRPEFLSFGTEFVFWVTTDELLLDLCSEITSGSSTQETIWDARDQIGKHLT